MLKGRQIAFMLYHSYRVSEVEGSLLEFEDLMNVTLKEDNVRGFINDWELCLSGLKTIPATDIMESLFRKQLDTSQQLRHTMELYTLDITQRGESRSYEQLMTRTKAHLDRRRLDKNRDDLSNKRSNQQSWGAAAQERSSSKGRGKGKRGRDRSSSPGPKTQSGDCHQFMRKGNCGRGAKCPFNHDKSRAQSRAKIQRSRKKLVHWQRWPRKG